MQERLANRPWKFYLCKPICGVQVVLAAFVNDAEVVVSGGVFIRQYAIDFVQLQ
jgi:hypothetical protein